MASPGSPVANSFMFSVLPCPLPRKKPFSTLCVRVQATTKYNLNACSFPSSPALPPLYGDFVAGLLYALANVYVCYPRRRKTQSYSLAADKGDGGFMSEFPFARS